MIAQSRLRRRVCRRVPLAPSRAPHGSGHRVARPRRGDRPHAGERDTSQESIQVWSPAQNSQGAGRSPVPAGDKPLPPAPLLWMTGRTGAGLTALQRSTSPQPLHSQPSSSRSCRSAPQAPEHLCSLLLIRNIEWPSPGQPEARCRLVLALHPAAVSQGKHDGPGSPLPPPRGAGGLLPAPGVGTALGSGGARAGLGQQLSLHAPPGASRDCGRCCTAPPRCPRGSHLAPELAAGQSPGEGKRQGMEVEVCRGKKGSQQLHGKPTRRQRGQNQPLGTARTVDEPCNSRSWGLSVPVLRPCRRGGVCPSQSWAPRHVLGCRSLFFVLVEWQL